MIFDPGRKTRTHSTVVKLLAERGIVSAYHVFYSENHGEETRPTYYFWRRKERGFHIDYIFVPHTWVITNFKIGTYKKWISSSDHVPILADIAEASHAQETNLDPVSDQAGCSLNSPPTP